MHEVGCKYWKLQCILRESNDSVLPVRKAQHSVAHNDKIYILHVVFRVFCDAFPSRVYKNIFILLYKESTLFTLETCWLSWNIKRFYFFSFSPWLLLLNECLQDYAYIRRLFPHKYGSTLKWSRSILLCNLCVCWHTLSVVLFIIRSGYLRVQCLLYCSTLLCSIAFFFILQLLKNLNPLYLA